MVDMRIVVANSSCSISHQRTAHKGNIYLSLTYFFLHGRHKFRNYLESIMYEKKLSATLFPHTVDHALRSLVMTRGNRTLASNISSCKIRFYSTLVVLGGAYQRRYEHCYFWLL